MIGKRTLPRAGRWGGKDDYNLFQTELGFDIIATWVTERLGWFILGDRTQLD